MNQIETKKIILNFMSFFVQAKIETEPQMSMQFVVFSVGTTLSEQVNWF